MNKDIILLQFGTKSAVVVNDAEYRQLRNIVSMKADVTSQFLLKNDIPPFAEKLDNASKKSNICYFVIRNVDQVDFEMQSIYLGLIKDRILNSYEMPKNAVVVLTVTNKQRLKNLSKELQKFCIVA